MGSKASKPAVAPTPPGAASAANAAAVNATLRAAGSSTHVAAAPAVAPGASATETPQARAAREAAAAAATAAATAAVAPRVPVNSPFPTGTVFEPWSDAETEDLPIEEVLRGKAVELAPLFKGRRVVLLGMPGAFTPNCTSVHVPGYMKTFAQFKANGVDAILALVVNDVFVCNAWRKHLGVAEDADGTNGVRIMCDTTGTIARAAGLLLDTSETMGRPVMRRFCALVEDGVLRLMSVESDGLGLQCTLAIPLLHEVKTKKYRTLFGIPPMPRDLAEAAAAAAGPAEGGGGAAGGAAASRSPSSSAAAPSAALVAAVAAAAGAAPAATAEEEAGVPRASSSSGLLVSVGSETDAVKAMRAAD